MAFVTSAIRPASQFDRRSTFAPSSPRNRVSTAHTFSKRHGRFGESPLIFTHVSPQQKLGTTSKAENESTVSSTDSIEAESILPTPVYKPSIFTKVFDVIRQDLRNVEVGRLYGPVYKSKNIYGNFTVVTNRDAIIDICRMPHLFAASDAFPEQFVDVLGHDAVIFTDGEKHKIARDRISPAFLQSTIPSYHDTIVDHARTFFGSLTEMTSTTSNPVFAPDLIKKYFLDLIVKLTMNVEEQNENNVNPENSGNYAYTSRRLSSTFIQFAYGIGVPTFLPSYRTAIQARDTLKKELKSLLYRRLRDKNARAKLRHVRECLQNDKVAKVLRDGNVDLISVFIATSSLELSDNDDGTMLDTKENEAEIQSLADLLCFIWFAGFTTQSGTLMCVLMEIFSDLSVLKRLQDEQSRVSNLSPKSLANDMPLLSSVITESMRVSPAVAAMFRRTTKDLVILQHYVSKGTVIELGYNAANMDGSVFQNPDEFIPDRFVNKPELARKVLMFGAVGSAHYCIGASLAMAVLKTTLAVMIREFDVDVKPWRRRSIKYLPETQPREGVWIRSCKPKVT